MKWGIDEYIDTGRLSFDNLYVDTPTAKDLANSSKGWIIENKSQEESRLSEDIFTEKMLHPSLVIVVDPSSPVELGRINVTLTEDYSLKYRVFIDAGDGFNEVQVRSQPWVGNLNFYEFKIFKYFDQSAINTLYLY